jgi:hypothetical protein
MCKVLAIPQEKRVNVFFVTGGIKKVICYISVLDKSARAAAERWSLKLPPSKEVEFIEVPSAHLGLSCALSVNQESVLAVYWVKATEIVNIESRRPNGRPVCHSYYFSQRLEVGIDQETYYFGGITDLGAELIEKIMY